jgi:hypothetical protein
MSETNTKHTLDDVRDALIERAYRLVSAETNIAEPHEIHDVFGALFGIIDREPAIAKAYAELSYLKADKLGG